MRRMDNSETKNIINNIGKIKNTNFKVASKPFHVFATRFLPNTLPNEVKDFVTN